MLTITVEIADLLLNTALLSYLPALISILRHWTGARHTQEKTTMDTANRVTRRWLVTRVSLSGLRLMKGV